ncbi:MAG: hypothetical protein AVO38_06435 [delta proteobacterium ML8_D]|jgi:hypothetical protein|nr:MAG: hypothetical protein AVO38_06435 [delta proteobacterium ML8_D]
MAKKGERERCACLLGPWIITSELLEDVERNLMGKNGKKSTDSTVNREKTDRKALIFYVSISKQILCQRRSGSPEVCL